MQKTAYEMRISDGSSDVCSSDLLGFLDEERFAHPVIVPLEFGTLLTLNRNCFGGCRRLARRDGNERHAFDALGRAGSTRAPGKVTDFGGRQRRDDLLLGDLVPRSEEHTSELQSLMRISYAGF